MRQRRTFFLSRSPYIISLAAIPRQIHLFANKQAATKLAKQSYHYQPPSQANISTFGTERVEKSKAALLQIKFIPTAGMGFTDS